NDLSFDATSKIVVNLTVHSSKNLDVTVTGAPNQMIALLLFRGSQQLTQVASKQTVRIKSLPVEAGAYQLTIKDLSEQGGTISFHAGTATSDVLRIVAPGYLVGKSASTLAAAKQNWSARCGEWQSAITHLYLGSTQGEPFAVEHLDRIEFLD